ncbi:MAG: efflux RND transporter permease subunit [Cyclobacteriaceae bacterium]|nr:efflux RND transporter permease subunit [Cyclobacteriaceae bacterium]
MASLSSTSISRPVLAIVLSLTILLFGVIGFFFLGVREYPSVDPPVITVSTSYIGANAEVIETQITEPLEESINGIQGIQSLSSSSRDGNSNITVEFGIGANLEAAANDVRDRVSRAMRQLPPDANPPIVTKADANSDPIVMLQISSDKRNLMELTEIANNVFKERFQTIPGVSQVMIYGEKKYSIRLWMDPEKLAAYQLTPLDIFNAVNSQNLELPTGSLEGNNMELTIRTVGRLSTPEEFNNLIVKEQGEIIVKFRDIGMAEYYPENENTLLRSNGVPMVITAIVSQPGSNNLDIADEFYVRWNSIQKDLPSDIQTGLRFDSTKYIRESITEVQQTIYMAFGLVVLIIFVFLRDWRTTLIPVVTIPISLVGTFFIMYIAGFSINVLTMLGIVLAIGLVVDDAIVVLENIYTKIESGEKPIQAALSGSKEIYFAVVSTTVALAAVFLPVIFLQGLTGRLFREFGIVVASAVIISSFVALSLTPMLSSRLLRRREKHNAIYNYTEPFFVGLNNLYRNALTGFLRVRWMALVIIGVSVVGIYYFMKIIPGELAPKEDRGEFRLRATGPEGTTFEYMDAYVKKVVEVVENEIPEAETIVSITSPGFSGNTGNSAMVMARLVDSDKRTRTQTQVVDALRPKVNQVSAARASISEPQSIGSRRSGLPVQYVIQAPTLDKLKEILPAFLEKASQDPAFVFVDVDLKFTKPEVRIEINREKARSLGVSVRDIAQTLQLGLSGQRFGTFVMSGKQYYVIGQVSKENRNDPLDLRSLYVRSNSGALIQLDNLISMTEQSSPPQLYRYNRFVSATIGAELSGDVKLGQGLDIMDNIASEVLDDSYSTALAGQSKEFRESSGNLYFAFAFALVIIYLILAAQFESFGAPFIIMFTVPLALAGTLLSLWYFGETLNIFSQIGIIMLIGLVTKNGILIVEFANQRRATGLSVYDAVVDASQQRFRPILMTSLSTILGTLPIALALGAGAESRVSMGIAVIGGLIFSTILTLFVIPAIYMMVTSKNYKPVIELSN